MNFRGTYFSDSTVYSIQCSKKADCDLLYMIFTATA